MRAAFIAKTGGTDVIQIGDLPIPTPKQDEFLIKVSASAVNPIDTYIRSGMIPMPAPAPYVLGCDFAGTIEALGPGLAPVKDVLSVGSRVWGTNQGLVGRQGTFAEYICVHRDWVIPNTHSIPDETLAASSLTGVTAHLGLFQFGDLKPEEIVFVNGGTGGVGCMVVQMAKAQQAKVIATVGSEEKAIIASDLGADLVLNYKTDDLVSRIKEFTAGKGVNLWYETQREHDFVRTIDLMAPRGRIILMAGRQSKPILPVGPFYVKCLTMRGFAMFNCTSEEIIACCLEMNRSFADGTLKPLIGIALPLEQAALAHQIQETGLLPDGRLLRGKVVVRL